MVRNWLIACLLLFQTTQTAVIKEYKKKLTKANKQKSQKKRKKERKGVISLCP